VALGAIVSSVRDDAGNPVGGALVVAAGPTTRTATTNAAGIVTLLGLPPGTYSVRVTRSGFEPYVTVAKIGTQAAGIKILDVHVSADTFADAGSAAMGATSMPFNGANAPYVAPELTAGLAADLLPVQSIVSPLAMPALALEGTRPGETRAELDGIPLAGGSASGATLRFRDTLDLADAQFVEGPSLSTSSLDGAIGGIVDYRTPRISQTFTNALDVGYDSAFGSFEHVRSSDTYEKIGALLDVVSGEGDNTSATAKAHLTLSAATSIAVAAYEAHDATTQSGTSYVDDAPAFAAQLRTTIGSGTLQGRVFSSDSDTTTAVGSAPLETESWQWRGLTLDYDVPLGENSLTVGYDRRSDGLSVDGGDEIAQSVTTLRLVADLQLSHLTRLDIGDAVARGSSLPFRNDPQVALALQAGGNVTLRFAAGSAYETAPEELAAAAGAGEAFAPETSFGLRASAEFATHAGDHLSAAAFQVRRFDSFAQLADARSTGVEFGFERPSLPGRLGVDAGLDLTRTYATGLEQPYQRTLLATPSLAGMQLAGDPYSKARLALTYDATIAEVRIGATLLGANNALSDRAAALADVSLRLRVAQIAALRLGFENAFGQAVADPELAPLYPPREVTFTLEY
jgi:hypothetical protein